MREKLKLELNPVYRCVGKKRLHSHINSDPSTSKRIRVSEDDTDIDENEVLTALQVSKQVRSSMKKWITKQKDVFLAQLREDEDYSLCITPDEKRLGSFSV